MKTFYASLVLFLLLILAIACNAVYVQHVAGELERQLRELPPCERADEALQDLERYRRRHVGRLGLSVPDERLNRLQELLLDLQIATAARSASAFERARRMAIETVLEIRRAELPSFGNLLSLYIYK
jgi:hypothetical protein